MQDEIFKAALAGLLHDVGKFLGRASPALLASGAVEAKEGAGQLHAKAGREFVEAYVPAQFNRVGEAVRYHHQPDLLAGQAKAAYELAQLVHLADRLAAGGSNAGGSGEVAAAALAPVLAQVELLEPVGGEPWQYQPNVLSLERDKIFPVEAGTATANPEAYQRLWTEHFQPELARWKSGSGWAQQSPETYFTTLMALLQRHLSFTPAVSPWPHDEDDPVWPDVSLFNHLKVTAAIAACLADSFDPTGLQELDRSGQPLALLVRGDLSGIQDFIYRITQPEADAGFDHVAKRLRGRSFYLSLLGEVLADWFTRRIGLPAANILFVGGGQFDLLIPLTRRTELQDCVKGLEAWLLKTFYGELGLQVASVELTAADFGDMRAAYQTLSRNLETAKLRKWADYLHTPGFFISTDTRYHRCRVCHLTSMDDPGVCSMCRKHAEVGQQLPQTTHLAFAYAGLAWPAGGVTIPFEPFEVTVGLLTQAQAEAFVKTVQGPAKLARLNPEEAFIRPALPHLAQSFSFLANTAPVATAKLREGNMQPVNRDDVLHFDAVAELSSGARRIGILKADVDRLGLLFGEGLAADGPGLRPTLGRVMALSSALDLFFAGWLNQICAEVFQAWQTRQAQTVEDQRHRWHNQVDGLFYVMYSGGDDLFIVGPWDEILRLAGRLQADFEAYACRNPNLTLSAGFVQVKPHYPVQRFARLVDEAESQAKQAGRARVTLFGQTVPWTQTAGNFGELIAFGDKLRDLLEANEMPRTLLHDLGRLYRVHQQKGEKKLKPMWTPRLYYTMARRLSGETLEAIRDEVVGAMVQQTILVPVSYASLITRKES